MKKTLLKFFFFQKIQKIQKMFAIIKNTTKQKKSKQFITIFFQLCGDQTPIPMFWQGTWTPHHSQGPPPLGPELNLKDKGFKLMSTGSSVLHS